MIKNGHNVSSFHSIFTDHLVRLQSWCCSNKKCRWYWCPSVKSRLGASMHTDLQRLYCELGAEQSYGKSARILAAFSSGKRAINNHQRLHKTAQTVAEAVAKQEKEKLKKPASTLVAQVDGGYVHDWEQRGHNYEVMVGKIYKPESIKTKGKNRTQIVNKQCAASAKKDKQATMKQRFLSAAFSEGLTMETAVTALSDGAKNCWCILRELEKHCLSVTYILDWFHIGKKLKTLENCLPADNKKPLAEIKKALWKGKTEAALWQLKQTKSRLVEETDIARLNDFHDYIARNKKYVVNYNERHHAHLPYTTHVVESTIEHLLNARCRKKQKMQWSRRGIDNVLQLRVAIVNQQWPSVWNTFIENHYKLAA